MKKRIIKFASDYDFIELPKPAIKYIPDWYKKTKPSIDSSSKKNEDLTTFKHCIPFLDILSSGYIFELWQDVEVEQEEGENPFLSWKKLDSQIFSSKPNGAIGYMPIPEGYGKTVYSFHHNLYLKTPPGYSVLITQPFNRTDLPFYALGGIIDTDISPMFPGQYPVFLKDGFSGVIDRGTPILQIIPFKRDSWESTESRDLLYEGARTKRIANTFLSFWYKRNAWSKKSYE
jgi:hypothetical protein